MTKFLSSRFVISSGSLPCGSFVLSKSLFLLYSESNDLDFIKLIASLFPNCGTSSQCGLFLSGDLILEAILKLTLYFYFLFSMLALRASRRFFVGLDSFGADETNFLPFFFASISFLNSLT